jgi:5-methylcytosine-specific restriction protein A
MGRRALRICSAGGCSQVVREGRCPKHQVQADARERSRQQTLDAARPSSGDRGYDADWRAVRRQYLAMHRACVGYGQRAGACRAPATEVDHVVSVAQAPDLRLRWSNLRAFCKPCHSARTASEQSFGRHQGRVTGREETPRSTATCEPGSEVPSPAKQGGGTIEENPKGPPSEQPHGLVVPEREPPQTGHAHPNMGVFVTKG